jgi:hypothetical protein
MAVTEALQAGCISGFVISLAAARLLVRILGPPHRAVAKKLRPSRIFDIS